MMLEIAITEATLDWFEKKNISFDNRFGRRITTGDKIYFKSDLKVEPYIGIHGGNVIADMGFMSYTNSLLPLDLKVGRYCSLAAGLKFPRYRHPIEHLSTSIFTHDPSTDLVVRFARDNSPGYSNFFENPQKWGVQIEHDVWIGEDAAIMPGVVLGTGCVVAANTVVTKSVEPYTIVGGNPARTIRKRFDEQTIESLLLSQWWNYKFTDFEDINLSSPVTFLEEFNIRLGSLERYEPMLANLEELAQL